MPDQPDETRHAEEPECDDAMHEGVGPAWPPLPEPTPPKPRWLNGPAFTAVWRDTLPFTLGGLVAATKELPQLMPGTRWTNAPEPDSELDVDQAIAAKVHLGMRTLPILAEAQLIIVEARSVNIIPDWDDEDELVAYGAEARLPTSPMFLDFEDGDGLCAGWYAEGWPAPLHLRGALCWAQDGMLSIVPYGSVDGQHPWGGTDYQAWARWIMLQTEDFEGPGPGPGDSIASDGDVVSWVDLLGGSICAYQSRVAYQLSRRVLRLLWAFEQLDVEFAPPVLPRPERRRAKRAEQGIGLVAVGLPEPTVPGHAEPDDDFEGFTDTCPVPTTHARLIEAHAFWHEALEAYHDPPAFVSKLNALIQTLRTVTWALQKELGPYPELTTSWYKAWQDRMSEDSRLQWAKRARNQLVHRGDLETHSKALVRIVGEGIVGFGSEVDADPSSTASEILRQIDLSGLSDRVRREGTLVVERRWTVAAFPDEELLDVLAHCYAVLSQIVAEAHDQLDGCMATCIKTADDPCEQESAWEHPSRRLPCMWAGREARTSRRNLLSGAPIGVSSHALIGPRPDKAELQRRYSVATWEAPSAGGDLFEHARAWHATGRQMLLTDGDHVMIAWLYKGSRPVSQQGLHPHDQREKFLIMEQLANEATRLGADGVILTSEAWEATVADLDDPLAMLRAAERVDRTEALVTHALRRDGTTKSYRSPMLRVDGALRLGDVTVDDHHHPLLKPFLDAWAEWSGASAR